MDVGVQPPYTIDAINRHPNSILNVCLLQFPKDLNAIYDQKQDHNLKFCFTITPFWLAGKQETSHLLSEPSHLLSDGGTLNYLS